MSKMTKDQIEAAKAYYKAVHKEKDFVLLTNEQAAKVLSQRLGFKMSENTARNIRKSLGLPTGKQIKIKTEMTSANTVEAVKTLAKTQSELTHIVISMLNRSPGYDQTAKESMLYNLNSIEQQTKRIAKGSTKKRKPCILGPRGTALKLVKFMQRENKSDEEIIQVLKDKYVEAGVKESLALRKAETVLGDSQA